MIVKEGLKIGWKVQRNDSQVCIKLRDSVTRFSSSGFFHESVSPKPLRIPLGPFQIFSKIRGDFRSSRFSTGGKYKKSSIIKVLII